MTESPYRLSSGVKNTPDLYMRCMLCSNSVAMQDRYLAITSDRSKRLIHPGCAYLFYRLYAELELGEAPNLGDLEVPMRVRFHRTAFESYYSCFCGKKHMAGHMVVVVHTFRYAAEGDWAAVLHTHCADVLHELLDTKFSSAHEVAVALKELKQV